MKTNRLRLLTLAALLATSPVLFAEEGQTKPERRPQRGPEARNEGPQNRRAEVMRQLNLTEEQRVKIRKAMQDQREKMQGLRDLPTEERREKMQEARQEMDATMKSILTAEQYKRWTELRQQNRGPGGPAGGGEARKAPKQKKKAS